MPLSGKSCSVRGRIGIEWSTELRYDVLADLLKAAMISVCESRKWGGVGSCSNGLSRE